MTAETGNIVKPLCKIWEDKDSGKYMGKIKPVHHFMKTIHKVLLAAVMPLVFCQTGFSQETETFKRHEISVGAAPIPFWPSVTGWEDFGGNGILEGIYGEKRGETRKVPLVSVSHNHYYKKWFSLNTRLSYIGQYQYIYSGSDSHVDHLEIYPGLNLMVMAQFTFLNKEKVRLYSAAGLGLTAFRLMPIPAIQFTFFGVSFGKKVFGFVETGGGTEYIGVHGGLGYRF